ncbi:hypothetical protein Csa_003295 [Cucumis sativus]|uniref:Uncharacterized protein n=1 Tax=Cucumis sativus TaxID=3659 RepID=A0A0A0KLP4_CUCSA|nr:hypothetical protein Csa_003295 [Cucumis sativus]
MTIDVDRMTVRETDWIGPGGLDGIWFDRMWVTEGGLPTHRHPRYPTFSNLQSQFELGLGPEPEPGSPPTSSKDPTQITL